MTEEKRKELLRIARDSISATFRGREYHAADDGTENHGAFVTIRLGGSLRGCIGFMEGIGPLGQMVADLAREAAFSDPRFPPLTEEELGRCTLEVSLLTEPEPKNIQERMTLFVNSVLPDDFSEPSTLS